MTAETLRKMAEAENLEESKAIDRKQDRYAAHCQGRASALREVAAMLEAEQAESDPQRHPQGHDAANRYAARGKP